MTADKSKARETMIVICPWSLYKSDQGPLTPFTRVFHLPPCLKIGPKTLTL